MSSPHQALTVYEGLYQILQPHDIVTFISDLLTGKPMLSHLACMWSHLCGRYEAPSIN